MKKKFLRREIGFDCIRTKIFFHGLYKTDAIPLSHKAFLNIERLKSDLKDSPVCLDLAYFQPQNKTEKELFSYFWVISPFFFKDAVNSAEKRIHNTFQIRGEKTQRQKHSLKPKPNLSIFVWNGSCCRVHNYIWRNKMYWSKS